MQASAFQLSRFFAPPADDQLRRPFIIKPNVSSEFADKVVSAWDALPVQTRHFLGRRGYKVYIAPSSSTARPELAQITLKPSQADPRVHYDQCGGLFVPVSKSIIVSEWTYRIDKGDAYLGTSPHTNIDFWQKKHFLNSAERTLRHEVGHAFGHALGEVEIQNKSFRKAHEADIAAMGPWWYVKPQELKYFTQPKGIGCKEVFADIWAELHGGGLQLGAIPIEFPRCREWMHAFHKLTSQKLAWSQGALAVTMLRHKVKNMTPSKPEPITVSGTGGTFSYSSLA